MSAADARDRRIQLVTGEVLDLSRPDLGRPDGTALWDRLSIGDGDRDRRVSSHDSPSARCLFPLCEGTGTGLVLVNPTYGRRYARHFTGEGGTRTHGVAHVDQTPVVDWLAARFTEAGYHVATERHIVVGDQNRWIDYAVENCPQPVAGEVQNRQTNHRQRARDAKAAGYQPLWTPKFGTRLLGVAQLRFLSDPHLALGARDPKGVRVAGFGHLEWVNGKVVANLEDGVRAGRVAEELPAGEWAEFFITLNSTLMVPTAEAARFAEYERRGKDDIRTGASDGLIRRHRHLLAQKAREGAAERARREADRRSEAERGDRERIAAAAGRARAELARLTAEREARRGSEAARYEEERQQRENRLAAEQADRAERTARWDARLKAMSEESRQQTEADRRAAEAQAEAERETSRIAEERARAAAEARMLNERGLAAFLSPESTAATHDTARPALDWSKNTVGRTAACVTCGRPAMMRNASGRPQHKICAEMAVAS